MFIPCDAPPRASTVFPAGRPSGIEAVSGGIFHNTQWITVIMGASGSSVISASDFASCGTPRISRGGDNSSANPVYRRGIILSCSKAGLVISRFSRRLLLCFVDLSSETAADIYFGFSGSCGSSGSSDFGFFFQVLKMNGKTRMRTSTTMKGNSIFFLQ
jgi:hypothetical protein